MRASRFVDESSLYVSNLNIALHKMTGCFFEKILKNSKLSIGICLFLLLFFIPLAQEILSPLFYIAYAVILAYLTGMTYHHTHRACMGQHTTQERAELWFLKLRLLICGAGLVISIGGFGLMGEIAQGILSTKGENAELEDIFIPMAIGLLAKIGCCGCFIAALMSRRLRLWLVGSAFFSSVLIFWCVLCIGVMAAFLIALLMAVIIPGALVLIGICIWIYTFYLLTRPCSCDNFHPLTHQACPPHPREQPYPSDNLPPHTHSLTLEGDKSHINLAPTDTPYRMSSGAYTSLCSDVLSLSSAPFEICYSDQESVWTLRVLSSTSGAVLHNNIPVRSSCVLMSGSTIGLEVTPATKTQSTDRQALSIALFGDIGHADIPPIDAPYKISAFDYKKACSDGELLHDCPYELITDPTKTDSPWFISPIDSSEWETLLQGELLTDTKALELGSTISLRRKGTIEEIAHVEVKGRYVYISDPECSDTLLDTPRVIGQLRVTVQHFI